MAYSGPQALPGLWPVKNQAGTAPHIGEYAVSATYAVTIGEGAIIVQNDNGARSLNGTLAAVTFSHVIGVAAEYLKASPGTGAVVKVYDDPDQRFVVIADGTISSTVGNYGRVTNVACLNGTATAAITAGVAYNGTLGQSNIMLDASEITATIAAGDLLQIVKFPQIVGETQLAKYAQVMVQITPRWHIMGDYKSTHLP